MTTLASVPWAFGLGGLFLGLILGIVIAYFFLPSRRSEKAFEEMKKASEVYRGQVHDHFTRTSELFQDLNNNYRALYDHLAKGAHSLLTSEIGAPELKILKLNQGLVSTSNEETDMDTPESEEDVPTGDERETGAEADAPAGEQESSEDNQEGDEQLNNGDHQRQDEDRL